MSSPEADESDRNREMLCNSISKSDGEDEDGGNEDCFGRGCFSFTSKEPFFLALAEKLFSGRRGKEAVSFPETQGPGGDERGLVIEAEEDIAKSSGVRSPRGLLFLG